MKAYGTKRNKTKVWKKVKKQRKTSVAANIKYSLCE